MSKVKYKQINDNNNLTIQLDTQYYSCMREDFKVSSVKLNSIFIYDIDYFNTSRACKITAHT